MMRKSICILAAVLTLVSCGQKVKTGEPAAAKTEVAELQQYTDIALPGLQGQTIKVSDYVGKKEYVLIDFWASWCGPCRAEMPTLVEAYERFYDKGLEIVGVSLDQNYDSWAQAIDAMGMKWPQMSDLRGWDCKGARLYGINSIPANVLIDKNGQIVARDLRGEGLLQKLESLFIL